MYNLECVVVKSNGIQLNYWGSWSRQRVPFSQCSNPWRIEKRYRELVLFELLMDVEHWTQQEATSVVNALLLKFLGVVSVK